MMKTEKEIYEEMLNDRIKEYKDYKEKYMPIFVSGTSKTEIKKCFIGFGQIDYKYEGEAFWKRKELPHFVEVSFGENKKMWLRTSEITWIRELKE